jgi:hypothetical protein
MVRRSRLKKELVVNLQSVSMEVPDGLSYDQMLKYAQDNLPMKKVRVESVEEF